VRDGRLILVYDGECGFCTRLARWVERRDREHRVVVRPSQDPGLIESLGLTPAEVGRAAWVVEPGGRRFEGAAAINRVLRELGGGWGLAATMYRVAPMRSLEDAYYKRVARRRSWW
jgi:predicted DCC family thiol-disulfide oxidoreductase YuxK